MLWSVVSWVSNNIGDELAVFDNDIGRETTKTTKVAK
jgi:hypothetical protein